MPTAANAQNPFEQAKAKLIERLQLLVCPNPVRIFPHPSDFVAVGDLLRDIAEINDDFIRAIGSEVEDNSPYHVDMRSFDAVATGACTDAIYECHNVGERMIEDREAA